MSWPSCATSGTRSTGPRPGSILHENVIPAFLGIVSFLVPQSVLELYGV